ncbi:hypothetical protein G647_00552 [Cladophialophora carrionii CBS 160.54]|uniref:Uncharacterized protein n=1 Tax=Cladophialophora carrionii CBS 160.54 TaxID=1279043 RepID=V9DP62_9EURO|nr:uncharacterized protein G647_00552 [Cladophialophora carrionii CBS 160.54]ETI28103.1 hypothetical protein G647_00552 [Cladophialophora carrionii CBS 160.54]
MMVGTASLPYGSSDCQHINWSSGLLRLCAWKFRHSLQAE